MPGVAKWYGQAFVKAFNGEIDWVGDAIKVMLCTDGYTPDQDAHVHKSDVTNELSATGYTAGGTLLTNRLIDYDSVSHSSIFRADDASWTLNGTFRWGIIYSDYASGDENKPLLGFIDFLDNIVVSNVEFRIEWDASGILTITASEWSL